MMKMKGEARNDNKDKPDFESSAHSISGESYR
jgi:hypothetical protein